MSDAAPSSLALADSGELARRAASAPGLLGEACEVCPRAARSIASTTSAASATSGGTRVVASYFPHFGEEDCLRGWRGSGTIFFSGCNLRCVFCQNYDISWQVKGSASRRSASPR